MSELVPCFCCIVESKLKLQSNCGKSVNVEGSDTMLAGTLRTKLFILLVLLIIWLSLLHALQNHMNGM